VSDATGDTFTELVDGLCASAAEDGTCSEQRRAAVIAAYRALEADRDETERLRKCEVAARDDQWAKRRMMEGERDVLRLRLQAILDADDALSHALNAAALELGRTWG